MKKIFYIFGPFVIGLIILYLSVGINKTIESLYDEFNKPTIIYTDHKSISENSSQPLGLPLQLMTTSPFVPGHPLQSIAPALEIASVFPNIELPVEPAGEYVEFEGEMISYIPSSMTQFLKTCDCKVVTSGVQSREDLPRGGQSPTGSSSGGGSLPPVFTNPNQNQMSPQ